MTPNFHVDKQNDEQDTFPFYTMKPGQLAIGVEPESIEGDVLLCYKDRHVICLDTLDDFYLKDVRADAKVRLLRKGEVVRLIGMGA